MHSASRQGTLSCAATFVRLIVEAAQERGVNPHDLCNQAGVDLQLLADNNGRIAQSGVNRLWLLAFEATQDPTIGLGVAQRVGPEALRLWNYSMMLSDTLLSAYGRATRDLRLLGDGMHMELLPHGDCHAIRFGVKEGGCPTGLAFDAALGGIVIFTRWLVKDEEFAPLKVELSHPAPPDVGPFEALFRCPVEFGQADNRLFLSDRDLQRPIPTGDPLLAGLFDRHVGAAPPPAPPAGREIHLPSHVRKMVATLLPRGDLKFESVAAALNMSERTLRRRLQQANLSYSQLLDDCRKELSAEYLSGHVSSVKEVAYSLGFAEQSNFHRAFKRWYGVSPGEYRNAAVKRQRPEG